MNKHQNHAAISGWAIVLMAVTAGYAYGYVWNGLVVPDNPAETITNIRQSAFVFKTGVLGWGMVILLDVLVSWSLYLLLRHINPELSMLMALLRLAYTVFLEVAVGDLVVGASLLDRDLIMNTEWLDQQILLQLESFESIWSFGLILFGLHLAALGILVLKVKGIWKGWGGMLILAGVSYTSVHFLNFLGLGSESGPATLEAILAIPMTVGELGFGIWLLVRGKKLNLNSF